MFHQLHQPGHAFIFLIWLNLRNLAKGPRTLLNIHLILLGKHTDPTGQNVKVSHTNIFTSLKTKHGS